MSDKAKGRVWEIDLPHNELWVLHAMADHADHLGRNIYAGHALIAYKCSYDVDTVIRIVARLVERGVLVLDDARRRPSKNNRYHINWDACPWKSGYEERRRGRPRRVEKRTDETSVNSSEMSVNLQPCEEKEPASGEKDPTSGPKRTDHPTRGPRTEPLKNHLRDSTLESTALSKNEEKENRRLEMVPSPGSAAPPPEEYQPLSVPTYVLAVVEDFSREFGDQDHSLENQSQATRLWERSGLSEEEFVRKVLYEARGRTRKHQTRAPGDPLRNRMAYFFTVARDLVANGWDRRVPEGEEGEGEGEDVDGDYEIDPDARLPDVPYGGQGPPGRGARAGALDWIERHRPHAQRGS